MLVPRAYQYSVPVDSRARDDPEKKRSPSNKGKTRANPKDSRRAFGWRPDSYQKVPSMTVTAVESKPVVEVSPPVHSVPPEDSTTEPPPPTNQSKQDAKNPTGRSLPVPVPSKRVSRAPNAVTPAIATSNRGDARTQRLSSKHDPESMPASVAALLAMTAIPRKKTFPRTQKPSQIPRRMSGQQLIEYWEQDYASHGSSLSASPGLDVLLSPPGDDDYLSRTDSQSSFDDSLYTRSLSNESIPSLVADEQTSSMLSTSSPSARGNLRRKSPRAKVVNLPCSVDDSEEHPLFGEAPKSQDESEEVDGAGSGSRTPSAISRTPPSGDTTASRRPSSFKSNLTASLMALGSSLRSLSNFATTPYSLPEDYLSRGLFAQSQQIQSEMRPQLDSKGPPTPELRRYLNPSAYHHKSIVSDFHMHGSRFEHASFGHVVNTPGDVELSGEGTLIALQDRYPGSRLRGMLPKRRTGGSRSGDDLVSAPTEADALNNGDGQPLYRRELRENGEFLRICVLETNMRRAGKFDGPGRAQLWLPARQADASTGKTSEREDCGSASSAKGKVVPRRWIGESAASTEDD